MIHLRDVELAQLDALGERQGDAVHELLVKNVATALSASAQGRTKGRKEAATITGAQGGNQGGFKGGRPRKKPFDAELARRHEFYCLNLETPKKARAELVKELVKDYRVSPQAARKWVSDLLSK